MIGRRIAESRFAQSRVGQRVFHALAPSRAWVVIFVVAIVGVNVWTLAIYRTQAKDEATHAAEIAANADSQYHQCVSSIPVLRKINGFISGEGIIASALVSNGRANLAATPTTSPLYSTRVKNLERLEEARAAAAQVKFPVPTRESCRALRAQLRSS